MISRRTARTGAGLPHPVSNDLLAALPPAERDRIVPALEVVPLALKALVQKPGDPVQFVHFPGGGFLSVVTVLEDGGMVEVATVGREGAVGVTGALDGATAEAAAIVQGESDLCYRMTADAFRREMNRRGAFYEVLTRYAHAFVAFIMQSTACNAVHSVEQRLARWLLMAHDRVDSDEIALTHEFLSVMLGVRRSGVTTALQELERKGLIGHRRSFITIIDREGLEERSNGTYTPPSGK